MSRLILIKAHADVNRWDMWGRAPLYAAVDFNTLPRGGRPDRPSLDTATPLTVIESLLKAGANPNVQLKLFPPYRGLGLDRGGDSMLTVGTTPLVRAAKAGDVAAVRLLLQSDALPNLPNSMRIAPLMAAAGVGSTPADTRGKFRSEENALVVATELVAAGASVNAARDNGQTALHGAAAAGWNQLIALLVKGGADLNAKDADGLTALDVAEGKTGRSTARGSSSEVREETAQLLRTLMAQAQPTKP